MFASLCRRLTEWIIASNAANGWGWVSSWWYVPHFHGVGAVGALWEGEWGGNCKSEPLGGFYFPAKFWVRLMTIPPKSPICPDIHSSPLKTKSETMITGGSIGSLGNDEYQSILDARRRPVYQIEALLLVFDDGNRRVYARPSVLSYYQYSYTNAFLF